MSQSKMIPEMNRANLRRRLKGTIIIEEKPKIFKIKLPRVMQIKKLKK
jgi:hypothetical protein